MERNYREKSRYYPDNKNEYQRHREIYPNKTYEDNYYKNNYRNNDFYRERGKYSYKGKYYNKYKERNRDNYDNRRYNDYNYYEDKDYNYKRHKSRSHSKERDLSYESYEQKDREREYKYRNKDYKKRRSRSNSRQKSSPSRSIHNKEKEKEKEPFVSAFTNFPFQLPEELTKNENYQNVSKLYNDNYQNNNLSQSNNNLINPQLNQNATLIPQIIRNPMITDSQFSLYSNPYLVQSLALLPTAQNTDKKLYIGNLPSGMTPPSLIKMLNITLQTLKPDDFSKEQPVIGAWVSPDGHYAFVEFRTAEEATKGFVLNGFKIMGVPLKIGRPKTYQGLPQTIEESGPSNTVASILMKSKKNIEIKKYKVTMPTKVLCLNSIIKGLDIEEEEKYNEIKEDLKNECEKYGKVLDIFMPRKDVEDNETPGMGNAYIMFDNIEQSKLARKFLSMKKFNNKLIYIQYLPEENFINKKFEPII